MRRFAVPFLLAAVLTGCSSTEPGKPSAGDQTGSAPTTGSSAGNAPVNRPKAVDMKSVDVCGLITADAKTTLKIQSATEREAPADYGEGSKACGLLFQQPRTYGGSLYTLTNGGVDRLKRTVGKTTELTETTASGYPAYLAKNITEGSQPDSCDLYIDANDGQLLLVKMGPLIGVEAPLDGACELSKSVGAAVGTALATA